MSAFYVTDVVSLDALAAVMPTMSDAEAAATLIRSAPALPTLEEIHAVDRAVAIARARGLALPEHVHIEWRVLCDDTLGAQRGGVVYLGLSRRTIDLESLARTALHELAHLHDRMSSRTFDRAEWEARAERFEAAMIPYWRAGTLPAATTDAT